MHVDRLTLGVIIGIIWLVGDINDSAIFDRDDLQEDSTDLDGVDSSSGVSVIAS